MTAKADLRDVQLLVDHEPANKVIYVAPAHRKTQSGTVMMINRPSCDVLESLYKMTYYTPEGDYSDVAARQTVSPFFDYFFGNAVRHAKLTFELTQRQLDEQRFIDEHRDLYETYARVNPEKASVDERVASLRGQLQAIDDNLDRLLRGIENAETPEERQAKRDQYHEVRAERMEERREVSRKLGKAEDEAYDLGREYNRAIAAWAPYMPDHAAIEKKIEQIAHVTEVMNRIAEDAFVRSEQKLSRYESVPVAYASAGYTIFDKEVGEVRQLAADLPTLKGYFVQELPLNNVNVSMVRANFRYEQQNFNSGSTERLRVDEHGSADEKPAQIGFEYAAAPVIFQDENGHPLPFVQRTMNEMQGSGIFNASVSRAAYCVGQTERKEVSYQGELPEGQKVAWKGARYEPRTTNLLAQAVALNYDYFVRTEPISVEWSANAKSAVEFFQNVGASRSFFNASTWDHATRKATQDHKMDCQVTLQPVDGETQEQQRVRMDKIEQRMKQEMMAEFITNAGARWTVVMRDSPFQPESLDAVNSRGIASNLLCGKVLLCRVADLGLNLARGLFGTSSNTNVVRNDQFVGNFRRSYKENAYTRARGVANVDLEVRL